MSEHLVRHARLDALGDVLEGADQTGSRKDWQPHRPLTQHSSTYLVPHARLDAVGDVLEGAHVERLLLDPHQLCVGIPPQFPHHQVEGEWRQLRDSKRTM